MDCKQKTWGGQRAGSGRPKAEGERHTYTVADDAHEWIMGHGGGEYLTRVVRGIISKEGKPKSGEGGRV